MTTLTLTPTLGRQSTRYPDGRPYKGAWDNPTRIVYPRPTAERDAGGANDGGLNGEYDKWLAGVPWYPCLGVMHGAFPYKVEISAETVDGVSASTGVQYAQYIEDHAATTPYLGFYHAGFTAPAAGIKVIAFLITVTDCLGTTDTYPVSLTVYAQDHASVLSHFRVVDTLAGSNGDGHWDTPYNIVSGADSLFGTDWASTTHCPKTVIALFKDGSVINPTGMTNVPGGGSATQIVPQSDYFPRTFIGVYGATVTVDFTTNPHPFNTQGSDNVNDILIKNIKFANNSVAGRNGINFGVTERSHIHDVLFDTFGNHATGSNEAPIRTSGVGGTPNNDCTILRTTFDKPYGISSRAGNNYGGISVISWVRGLVDDVTFTNIDNDLDFPLDGLVRIKHNSEDCEFRRISILCTTSAPVGQYIALVSGGATGFNNHLRMLVRHCNLYGLSVNAIFVTATAPGDTAEHSLQLLFNSLRGGVTVTVEDEAPATANERQFLAYKNLIENTAGGMTLTNTTTVTGESSQDVENVKATSGILTTAGLPVDSQYLGAIGHTVITV